VSLQGRGGQSIAEHAEDALWVGGVVSGVLLLERSGVLVLVAF
jgi:hypothetical protein